MEAPTHFVSNSFVAAEETQVQFALEPTPPACKEHLRTLVRPYSLRTQCQSFDVDVRIEGTALPCMERFSVRVNRAGPGHGAVPNNCDLLESFVSAMTTINARSMMEEFVYVKVVTDQKKKDVCGLVMALPKGAYLWASSAKSLLMLGFDRKQLRSVSHMHRQYGAEAFPREADGGYVVDNPSPQLRVNHMNSSVIWECSAYMMDLTELICADLDELSQLEQTLQFAVIRRETYLGRMEAHVPTFETMPMRHFGHKVQKVIDDALFEFNVPLGLLHMELNPNNRTLNLKLHEADRRPQYGIPFAFEVSVSRSSNKKILSVTSIAGLSRYRKKTKNKLLKMTFEMPCVLGSREDYPLKMFKIPKNAAEEMVYLGMLLSPESTHFINSQVTEEDTTVGVTTLFVQFISQSGQTISFNSNAFLELKYTLEKEDEAVHFR